MMRLIDADALAESLRESKDKLGKILSEERCEMEYRICEGQMVTFIEAILRVKDAPTIDAVHVVRCRDCRYRKETERVVPHCILSGEQKDEEDFCSWGYRRYDNE